MKRESIQHASPTLLSTDMSGSVLRHHPLVAMQAFSYTAYGSEKSPSPATSLLGFNGELRTPIGGYLLGNGYRTYNPALMRFNSPDSLSPFEAGGLNPYSYCSGDPINNIDPSGHMQRASKQTQLSPRQQIGSILSRQVELKTKINSITAEISINKKAEEKLNPKLENIQASLKKDRGLKNSRSGLHSSERAKAEERKDKILGEMVGLEKARTALQNKVTEYQDSFRKLNTELDVIEDTIGTTAFNAIYDDIMQPADSNSSTRSNTN
ncbi:RHS repeat-associated core domain-containing protein [Pseudomonas mosselii]|uniref:RHS repeat-associated core domain-containing protein n=1 Tax=Pseudomonas mosselii TaxID=78327 RepID=UPI000D92F7AC|nr:RHS repeat-associated core domain-containing protein [Pseudomonas mosselii]PYC26073.1 hypothetical protein DMX06_05245 [Pseudomonas mosselii]